MSNLLFNIRFGSYHLQLSKEYKLSFHKNKYYIKNKPNKWFAVYCWFGIHYE